MKILVPPAPPQQHSAPPHLCPKTAVREKQTCKQRIIHFSGCTGLMTPKTCSTVFNGSPLPHKSGPDFLLAPHPSGSHTLPLLFADTQHSPTHPELPPVSPPTSPYPDSSAHTIFVTWDVLPTPACLSFNSHLKTPTSSKKTS